MNQVNYEDMLDKCRTDKIYKKINFYPLKIKDYEYIDKLYMLFGYPKRFLSLQDPIIYKMSYLKFLLLAVQQSDSTLKNIQVEDELINFLSHVTRAEDIYIGISGSIENLNTFDYKIVIENISFSAMEFDKIREIVLRQNGSNVEYIEEYDDRLEDDLKFIRRNHASYTFKDKVFLFASLSGKTIDEIKDCTLYEMENLIQSADGILSFQMQTIPLTNVQEDYKIKPYATHLDIGGRYDEILMDTKKFKEESDYFNPNKGLKQIKK